MIDPTTEDELHAYIDGELPGDRMEAVASSLAAYREQAALVRILRAQAEENLQARYGAAAEEPAPERLKLDQALKQDRANGRSWAAMAAAAAVVAFIVGGAGRLDGTWCICRGSYRVRCLRQRSARRLQALRG